MRRLRRARRGAMALWGLWMVGYLFVPALFVMQNISSLTIHHSRMTEAAQLAAYAAASAGRAQPDGWVQIDGPRAQALAASVVDDNLDGLSFERRAGLAVYEVRIQEVPYNPFDARRNAGGSCTPPYCWTDGFGDPHYTSGVMVVLEQDVPLSPVGSLRLRSTGFADYTFQTSPTS